MSLTPDPVPWNLDEPPKAPEPDAAPQPVQTTTAPHLGRSALVGAVMLVGVETAAIILAVLGSDVVATALAYAAIAGSVVTFVAGGIAVVAGRRRRLAIAAMLVSLAANPLVVRVVLEALA